MLAKAHFANFLLYPTTHLLDTKVVIAARIRLQDTIGHYVGNNKFAALSVALFEELRFNYGI